MYFSAFFSIGRSLIFFIRLLKKEWLNMFVISRIILKDIQKLNIKNSGFLGFRNAELVWTERKHTAGSCCDTLG